MQTAHSQGVDLKEKQQKHGEEAQAPKAALDRPLFAPLTPGRDTADAAAAGEEAQQAPSPTTTKAAKGEVVSEVQPAGAQAQVKDQGAAQAGGSRKLLILLHGEKANDPMVRSAISRLREEGHQVVVRVTFEAGDVDRLVSEALKLDSAQTLVAAGGDGTVCEVVAALLKHTGGLEDTRDVSPAEGGHGPDLTEAQGRPPAVPKRVTVAVLPLGTSNDFAATTGIPEDPYEALLLATREDRACPVDVGLLNGKPFMNSASIGASADIGKTTSSSIKKVLGPAAFLFTGARAAKSWHPVTSVLRFPNIPERHSMDEHEDAPTPRQGSKSGQTPSLASELSQEHKAGAHEAKPGSERSSSASPEGKASAASTDSTIGEVVGIPLLHLTAANNRQVASTVVVSPTALLDDGMLDCAYLTGTPGQQVSRLLSDVMKKGAHKAKSVTTLLRVPWLEVSSEEPLEWSVDGEPMDPPSQNFRLSLLHRAVYIHFPDDRMLVAGQEPAPAADQAAGGAASSQRKHRHKLDPRKIARGRLKVPSVADVLGKVVRFRKRKDWGRDLRALAGTLLRTLLIASLGGLAVHYLETVRSPAAAASKRAAVDSTGNSGRGRKAVRQAEQEAEEEGRQFRSRVRGLFAGLGRKERVRVEPAALAI